MLLLDCLLAVGCGGVQFFELYRCLQGGDPPPVPIPVPILEVLVTVIGLTVVVRRRWPATVTIITVAAYLAHTGTGYVVTVAVYALAAHAPPRRTALVAGASFLAIGVADIVDRPVHPMVDVWATTYLVVQDLSFAVVAPLAFGLFVCTRRRLVDRLQRERSLLAEQARVEERGRLAREMHDVVAHKVSLMTLHAGGLEVALDPGLRQVRDTGRLISSLGREAVRELRQVTGLLRADRTLADLEELAEQSRRAGMRILVRSEGVQRPLPSVIEHVAYRVVQEALTNVHKHVGSTEVEAVVRYLPTAIEVSVVNTGGPSGTAVPGARRGLNGLCERVSALGGTLKAGPRTTGGFQVVASVPVPHVVPT